MPFLCPEPSIASHMHSFPVAAVTNDPILSLKQDKFIILQFWSQKSDMILARSKVLAVLHLFVEALEENSASLSFPASRGHLHSLVPFLPHQSQLGCISLTTSSMNTFLCDHSWRKSSAFKDSWWDCLTWIIQAHLPISRSVPLIPAAMSLLPYKVTYSQVPKIRARTLWGHYSAYHK